MSIPKASLAFFFLSSTIAMAQGPSTQTSGSAIEAAIEAAGMSDKAREKPAPSMTCGAITDSICNDLWSPANKGRLKVHDGLVLAGRSKRSELAQVKLEDLQALLNSEKRLPQDTRKALRPLFAQLKAILKKEKDSKAWYRDLGLMEYKMSLAVTDVARARVEKKNPALKKIKEKDLKFDQIGLYWESDYKANDEILEAKYAQHPNWLRVKSAFSRVQNDLLKVIAELKIPKEDKDFMSERIKTVSLKLPYSNPKVLGAEAGCGTTTINASYFPSMHSFTMCAGFFNAYQSEASLYHVMAHEIGHSIDGRAIWNNTYKRLSLSDRLLRPLLDQSKPPIACQDWAKIKADILKRGQEIRGPQHLSLQGLYDCMEPKNGLAPFEPKPVIDAAMVSTRKLVDSYANANSFVQLSQPTIQKDGKVVENEFFRRPDRMTATQSSYLHVNYVDRFPNLYEIFNQALECASLEVGGKLVTYKDAPESIRSQLFDIAIEETQAIDAASNVELFDYCGQNCVTLQEYGFSRDSNEKFADWIAYRAFKHYLDSKKTLNERRQATALATILFCQEPSVIRDAPDLAAVEKKYSLAPHPESRIRRLSLYNMKNAELAECRVDEAERGFSQCEP